MRQLLADSGDNVTYLAYYAQGLLRHDEADEAEVWFDKLDQQIDESRRWLRTLVVVAAVAGVLLVGLGLLLWRQMMENRRLRAGEGGDWDLFVCRPDGTSLRNITRTPRSNEAAPQFSRDGRKMLYRRQPPSGNARLMRWRRKTMERQAELRRSQKERENLEMACLQTM